MGNVVIDVAALICEDPIFQSVTYTGNPYVLSLNWLSKGEYYSTFDNTVTMYLLIELFRPSATTPYFQGYVATPPPIPYIGNNFLVNILDYDNTFANKDKIVFTLYLAGEASCNTETSYTIPGDTLP